MSYSFKKHSLSQRQCQTGNNDRHGSETLFQRVCSLQSSNTHSYDFIQQALSILAERPKPQWLKCNYWQMNSSPSPCQWLLPHCKPIWTNEASLSRRILNEFSYTAHAARLLTHPWALVQATSSSGPRFIICHKSPGAPVHVRLS